MCSPPQCRRTGSAAGRAPSSDLGESRIRQRRQDPPFGYWDTPLQGRAVVLSAPSLVPLRTPQCQSTSSRHPTSIAAVRGTPATGVRRVAPTDRTSQPTASEALVAGAGAPTRAQQSNADQQMSFRNRWSSSTSSRIASASWSRCHWHSSCPAASPSPSGAAARAALIA